MISGALSHFGHSKLSAAANSLGYGRKRRIGRPKRTMRKRVVKRRVIRRVRGAGNQNFFSTQQLAVPKF